MDENMNNITQEDVKTDPVENIPEVQQEVHENVSPEPQVAVDEPAIEPAEQTENASTDAVNNFWAEDGAEERIKEEFNYYPPIVDVTPVSEPDPANKRGLRFFALILAAVILLSSGMAVGYYMGKDSGRKNTSVSLEAKPVDKDMYTAAQVYDAANECVVGIYSYNSSNASSASGVVYSEDGYIVTNDHIYDGIGAARFKVYTHEGKEYDAEFVAGDTRSDIAVIKITDSVKLKPATFGNPDELYIGEPVVAIGRPTGATTENNITSGIISLLDSRISVTSSYSTKHIQTNAAINPGSSGGALLNMYGQVVGITSSKIAGEEYEGMGFAIPMDDAKKVIDSLIKNGYVANRAKLGISYREVNSVTAEVYDMVPGLNIAAIDESSDLYGKAAEGDTIVGINGVDIVNANQVLDVIDEGVPGQTITLTIHTSKGTTKTVSVKLLADNGGSSYSKVETKPNTSSQASGSNESEFSFPFGD